MPVDVSGGVALCLAAMSNRPDVVKHLLHEGANVNKQTRYRKSTPLHLAGHYNFTEVAWLLVDKGADINMKNGYDETPLDVARKGSEVESLLLQLQLSAP